MTRRRDLLGAALSLAALPAALPGAARAGKDDDTLRIAWRDAVPDLDPYRNQLRTGFVLAHHVWDCLVDRDPETFQMRPLLAASWQQEDETTWRFTLRPDLRFHDGSPCGPEDVAYTVATARDRAGVAVPGLYGWLAGAEPVDATQVRLKLREPFPAALDYFAAVLPILPRAYRERVGPEGFAQAPVGTGPYRVRPSDAPDRVLLERFDGYFPDGPKGRPAIARLAIRTVADPLAELAALLADRADWIWEVGPHAFAAIGQAPGLQALSGGSMRLGYLSLDAAGRSGAGSPLTDLRVRQAICHAIDRGAIARRLAGVATRVPDAPCFPTQFGCDAGAAVRHAYDPAKARALLAEAGHADGFATQLVSYVLPEEGTAVRADLQAVGITAELVQLPTADALARAEAGQAPLFLGSWGSYSINDVAAILPQFFGGGPLDYARDPEVQGLVARAGRSGDADVRRGLYGQAIRRITAQAFWLPMHTYTATYGMTRALNFRPSSDELPRFYLAGWR
ncbi:MAG TPA: ABC transporter substrate-binding protein [Acetobacteraceae bacterium]|nr:ABC transporter substrate-binding protein [Acetobacteraceae bacterium]